MPCSRCPPTPSWNGSARRRWIFLILLIWGALSASNAAIHNASHFYAVRILLGIVEAGFFPGMILYLTYWFTKSYPRPAGGAVHGGGALGQCCRRAALKPDPGPERRGRSCRLAMAVCARRPSHHAAGLCRAEIPARRAARRALAHDDEKRGIITARLASDDTSEHRNFWLALRDPRVYALGVVYFGYSIAFYGVGLWMPQIVQGMGVSNLMTGFAIAPAYFVAMIAMILWGRSSDKRGERVWHVALPALMMMTAFLIGSVAHDNLVIFLMLSLVLVGSMALQGPFWVLPSSFLGGAAAAGGIALINTMGTAAGGFAGPYILGLIKQATGGYAAGMAALAIGPLLTASIVLALGRAAAKQSLAIKTTI